MAAGHALDVARAHPKTLAVDPVQSAYRRALSAAVVEHAKYLAAQGEKQVTPHLIDRRKRDWQAMEVKKARLLARLAAAGKRG